MKLNKDYFIIAFLAVSGLLITLVSAFFSIKGFVLFIPDPELYIGLLGLGVAFEIAKVTASTFLFHRMSDGGFPILFKVIMTSCVIALVVFSAVFTFVHLNASASKSLAQSSHGNTEVTELVDRNVIITDRIKAIGSEMAAIPEDMPSAKTRMYKLLNPERETLQKELTENTAKLSELRKESVESDQFVFLTTLAKFTGMAQDKIFVYVTAFIVCVIDPLAISLFLCASYVFAKIPRKKDDEAETVESLKTEKENIVSNVQKGNLEIQELLQKAIAAGKDNTSEVKSHIAEGNEDVKAELNRLANTYDAPKQSDDPAKDLLNHFEEVSTITEPTEEEILEKRMPTDMLLGGEAFRVKKLKKLKPE